MFYTESTVGLYPAVDLFLIQLATNRMDDITPIWNGLAGGGEGMEHGIEESVEVICQFGRDGSIIPLRIRIEEDGEYHTYTIRSYRDMSYRGAYTTSGGVFVSNKTLFFECNIDVLGRTRLIQLYYETDNRRWKIAV